MNVKMLEFEVHGDERGNLVSVEEYINIPFRIKRVYYIFDTIEDIVRGKHAHRNLEQVLICVHGKCKVSVEDGQTKKIIELSKANQGLYIKGLIWREMYDFSEDAVLMVLASDMYNEKDYIRDYDEFLNLAYKERV